MLRPRLGLRRPLAGVRLRARPADMPRRRRVGVPKTSFGHGWPTAGMLLTCGGGCGGGGSPNASSSLADGGMPGAGSGVSTSCQPAAGSPASAYHDASSHSFHWPQSSWLCQLSQSFGSVFVTCFCGVGGSGTPGVFSAGGGPGGGNGTGFDMSCEVAAATGMLFARTTTPGDWHRVFFCAVGESCVS